MTELRRLNVNTNNGTGDAFGRLRTSQPETLFDSKQIFDNQPLFWDDQETSGTGTSSTHSVDTASTTLSVSATTAGTRTKQTFQRFNYQPGKSQLAYLTGVLASGGGTGIIRRAGLFDDDNGVFFEDNAGTLRAVVRTSTSGSPVDNATASTSWNIDPMDGTGPSGITLDLTKAQILVIDFEWLGVGRVRFGFNVDGVTYYCHEVLNANNVSTVYMSTPNLPVRYQIINDGTGAASTLVQICSSIQSEGGAKGIGVVRSSSTDGTHVDANTKNTWYAIKGIRLKSGYIGATVDILSIDLQLQTASSQIHWALFLNPTVAGTFTYGDETNSAVQSASGATANTVTGGIMLESGFLESAGVASGSAGSLNTEVRNLLTLGSAINGTVDEIVLCAKPIGGSTNVDVEGSITWQELS